MVFEGLHLGFPRLRRKKLDISELWRTCVASKPPSGRKVPLGEVRYGINDPAKQISYGPVNSPPRLAISEFDHVLDSTYWVSNKCATSFGMPA